MLADASRTLLVVLAIAATFFAGVLAASAYATVRRLRRAPKPEPRHGEDARDVLVVLGEALAATHNPRALLAVILDATVDATSASGGTVLIAGEAAASVGTPTAREPLVLVVSDAPGEEVELQLYPPPGGFTAETELLASSIATQGRIALENVRLHRTVEQQALTDDLTLLPNRRHFMQALGAEVKRAERFGGTFSVLIADLDDFKAINDRFGHEAGDVVLQSVAEVLRGCLRDVDLPARLGGEEFAIVVPETDLEGAYALADRIRTSLERHRVTIGDVRGVAVTTSIGIATYASEATPTDLLRAADVALYRAKAEGKNRSVGADRGP